MFKSITNIPNHTKVEKLDAVFTTILNNYKLRIKINILKTTRNFDYRYKSLYNRLNSTILKVAKGVK